MSTVVPHLNPLNIGMDDALESSDDSDEFNRNLNLKIPNRPTTIN